MQTKHPANPLYSGDGVFFVAERLPAALAERISTCRLRAVFLWTCEADVNRSTVQLFAVKLIDCFLVVVFVFEFNKTKAFRSAAITLCDNSGAADRSDGLEKGLQGVISGRISQTTDKQILGCHVKYILLYGY
jgi:hypothetical protein